MLLVGLIGFAGVAVFAALYIVFFLKGFSLKLPLIGMAVFAVAVAVSAVLLNLPAKGEDDAPDATGSPSQPAQSESPAETDGGSPADTSVAGQVLLDKRGVKITTAGFDGSASFGPELKLRVENTSETDVTIQLRNPSVNGYMADTVCSIDAPAGQDTEDSITFLSAGLQRCGIVTVADMEFAFHIIDKNRSTFLDSDIVSVSTPAADTYQYQFDDSGQELHSEGGIRIVSKGISQTEGGAVLFLENTSDRAVTIQIKSVSVNGSGVDTIFSQNVSAGRHAVYVVAIPTSLLDQKGVQEIAKMGFEIHVTEQDGQTAVFDAGPFTVQAA